MERNRQKIASLGIGPCQATLTSSRMCVWRAALQGTFSLLSCLEAGGVDLGVASCVTPLTKIGVKWTDAETGNGGDTEITFLDAGSLAAELYACADGTVDDFRVLDGGWLYLVGQPDLFWSAMAHRKESGCDLVLPPLPPTAEVSWMEAFCMKELDRIAVLRLGARDNGVHLRDQPSLGSQSMAATLGGEFCIFGVMGGIDPAKRIPSRMKDRPKWWKEQEVLWGGGATRAKKQGKPQCMFYCTPIGCAQGSACEAWHDEIWKEDIERIKSEGGGIKGVDRIQVDDYE